MHLTLTPLIAMCVLGLAACGSQDNAAVEQAPVTAPATADTQPAGDEHAGHDAGQGQVLARAALQPTKDSQVQGTIEFMQVDGKLHAMGQVSGLAPRSEHGFHIHEKGDCSAPDGSSAGGHFNPASRDHGSVTGEVHHGGDMPNIVADADGNARVHGPGSPSVNIGQGDGADIIGRGLIVHADPDDYTTQPTGNAGARLACAVIKAAQ